MENKLYELTNPQKSIWYTEEYYKGTPINNICCSVIIYEKVDIELLKKALFILIQTNDSFRIRLFNKADIPMQYISDFAPFDIELSSAKDEEEFTSISHEFVNHTFDLYNENLFKFKIVSFPDKSAGVILNVHHLISDSWSLGLTTQELLKIYHSILNNSITMQENNSYVNYIAKEHEYKTSQKYIADQTYWNNLFAVIPVSVSIPSEKYSTNNSSFSRAKRLNFSINADILKKIAFVCKQNNFSQLDFFMAIFSIYISNVCNSNDFVIGTPILNRTGLTEKNTTGMFVNTIPVKINFRNSYSFIDLAQSISTDMLSNLRHQKYSYNSILEDLRNKNSNIQPLYNIMLSYQITKAYNKALGNYKTNWIFNNYGINDIDIHLLDANDTGELDINYDYLIDKYNEQDIIALHDRIMHIISQIIENPNINVNQVEILTNEEKNKLLYEFNNTSMPYSKDKTITDLFEEQVEKTPDNTALVFENQKLTYKELNEKANSLAHFLRFKKNIARNEFVGIMVNRSLEMIISILAVLKAGCAYIPIDPTYPKERIDYMLTNSNAKILLTQNILHSKIDFKNIVCIDLTNDSIYNSLTSTNLEHINEPNDTSYVIFTSGSTGKPKGVVLNHKALSNLTNYCNHYIDYLKSPSNMAIVSITTISFDIFIFETLISLQRGLQLIIANENEQNSPNLLNNLIQKYNIKIIQSTPSRMQTFLNNKEDMPYLSNLEYITLAGEQLPLKLVQDLSSLCGATIYNGYGPSETTVFSTLTKMNTNTITIGKPLDNTQIYILNNNLNILPVCVSGEIYISGDGVGKGYLNNKELTDKSFINNPFLNNAIMYKTGDIGYYTNTGEIICLGRIDNQIKIRGQRIELGEIENKINSLPFINSCAVIKKSDDTHEYLCAYFTSNIDVNNKDVEAYLEQSLPKYMIPRHFTQLNELPYTPNGKIDRKALTKICCINREKVSDNPRNSYDVKLIEILKNILHMETVSINDDFLDIGGDSLSAITLSAYIQREFKVQIYVKDILNNSKISDLSDFIANNSSSVQITIKPVSKSSSYNVSSAQRRIFFASKMDGENSILYNIPGGIILDKELDTQKLEKCINTIIERQESLRTYFKIEHENVVQKIKENINFKLEVINNINFNDIDSVFKKFVKPFDLSNAPLFRINYIKFTNGKNAIFIDMHHIISDGTSLSIFIDELIKLYNNEFLPQPKVTYKDYSAYEKEKLESDILNESKEYWINQFKDEIPILNLQTNFSRTSSQSFVGKKVYSVINEELSKKLIKLCNVLRITPYMFLLACYYILLSKYTSQDDIVIGSPIVSRDLPETYNIIGMFVNTLALRNKIEPSSTFKEFVLDIKENTLNAFKYQTYPFDELVKNLNISRDTSRNPLFDTMFTYQNNGYKEISINDTKATYYIPDTNISKFDLSVEIIPKNDKFDFSFEFATNLFTEEFIQNMTNHYLNVIKSVVINSDEKIANIDILSDEERNQILYTFNNTSLPYPKDKTIVDLFEEQANKNPNKIALVYKNQKLTYKELNEKANCLARYFSEIGISKSNIVPIIMNRSIDLILSMLAVIKLGAVYLPISVETPLERIKYIIKNSNAKNIITNIDDIPIDNVQTIYAQTFSNLEYSNTNLNIQINPSDLLYIIYTSGSTGNPKGVKICHSNLSNFIHSFNKIYEDISTDDRVISSTNISFDVNIFEVFISLLNGCSLYLYEEQHIKDVYKFCEELCNNQITFAYIPPNILDIVYNILSSYNMVYLKKLLIGVEPIQSALIKKYYSLNPHLKIVNAYGPTEATICSTAILLNNDILDNYKIIPIGKPLHNLKIFILDRNLKPVPFNIPGEIYISGDNVSNGYLFNETLSSKAFIPLKQLNCDIAYKTGDLAKLDRNGNINFIGRNDFQIKINGYRIETNEIESLILKYPNIKKAIVLKQSINNRNCLVAYFSANQKINISNLKKYLLSYLPKYMIPTYFVAVEQFSYTPNGKLDKKALPLPNDYANIQDNQYVPPKTLLQKKLVDIFENLLNIRPIGIYDNFFDIGGDSLLAMNLNIELKKISNKINYQDIFNHPTIVELEEKIISVNNNSMFMKIENLSENQITILNTSKKRCKINKFEPNGILLFGATGFLGIHILKQFIDNSNSNIYCVVRQSQNISAEERLKQKLNYYFGKDYKDLFNHRIFILHGDITKKDFDLDTSSILNLSNVINTVINSAATVYHFGIYQKMYESNVLGVKNVINFCNNYNKKLYHISTTSVSGLYMDTSYLVSKNKYLKFTHNKKIKFDESNLYIGQNLENIYVKTKFESENLLLNEISHGLDAYILRMGHLMHRYSDGVFQENILDNKFVSQLVSFIKLGKIPKSLYNWLINFTPVDDSSKAIYKIITHPSNYNRIFHISNPNLVSIKRIIKLLRKRNISVDIMSDNQFADLIKTSINNSANKEIIKNLIYDLDTDIHINSGNKINTSSTFTENYLKRCGFMWHKNTNNYLIKLIDLIKEII